MKRISTCFQGNAEATGIQISRQEAGPLEGGYCEVRTNLIMVLNGINQAVLTSLLFVANLN